MEKKKLSPIWTLVSSIIILVLAVLNFRAFQEYRTLRNELDAKNEEISAPQEYSRGLHCLDCGYCHIEESGAVEELTIHLQKTGHRAAATLPSDSGTIIEINKDASLPSDSILRCGICYSVFGTSVTDEGTTCMIEFVDSNGAVFTEEVPSDSYKVLQDKWNLFN